MSYETNPILNRLKLLKGWKNPTFPTKTLNYSREIVLWFKIYLFLKVYLLCQNIKLLTCEIRTSEVNTKVLYLSISKHIPKKKNIKSKWKTKSFLQNIKSPFIKTQNKKARFLLYRDLRTLKQKSEFFFNKNRRKIFSKPWISKSRRFSWVNFSCILHGRRRFRIKQNIIFWKKTKNVEFLSRKFVNDIQKSKKRNTLWKRKQKNILILLRRLQKDLLFVEKLFSRLSTKNFTTSTKSFQILTLHLNNIYQKRKHLLEKIENSYQLLLAEEIKTMPKSALNYFSNHYARQTYQRKKYAELTNFFTLLKKNWLILKKKNWFRFPRKKRAFLNKTRFWKSNLSRFLLSSRKNMILQRLENKLLFGKIYKLLLSRNLFSLMLFPKISLFKKPLKLRDLHGPKLLRFEQKKQLHSYKRILQKRKKSKFSFQKKKRLIFATSKRKTKKKQQKLAYRLSFRYNYRQNLKLITDFKLKYLIADLIQTYFSLVTCVKLFWPLRQFKNMKFYRLFFPEYQQYNFKNKNIRWDLTKELQIRNKNYLYVGQNTNHFKIREHIFKSKAILETKLKIKSKIKAKKKHRRHKKLPALSKRLTKKKILKTSFKTSGPQRISNQLSHFWQEKAKKKNKYLILKKKIVQLQSEKRLFWASKQSFISNLTVTLTLFAKYLEVQPLADHLAKIIGDTKKHALILKVIKTVLKTLVFKRGVGYRIALLGRINGANKSRILYLKKLNRNRSRQTFSKNVNFAMAQARATIGVFGVKIWVYS
jgi:hypothetical protein